MIEDAELLLLDLINNSDDPNAYLRMRFEGLSYQEDAAFRGLIKILIDGGYLQVPAWGDNLPAGAFLTSQGIHYKETKSSTEKTENIEELKIIDENMAGPRLFISHRSEDKAIADMMTDFLAILGLPKKRVFCSSLPGNDVRNKISNEVKI